MLPELARIDRNGAIQFLAKLCIDGHVNGCFARIVTHIHSDHTLHLNKSITYCKYIAGTPTTLDLLDTLGHAIPKNKQIPLGYSEITTLDEYKVRFEFADHIPGSAQVVVEHDGLSLAYTSDFKNPGTRTKIIEQPHVLVIDATYGNPKHVREKEEVIWSKFVELLKKLLMRGSVALYAYYGKAQDIMLKLREWGIDAPFLLTSSQWRVYKVLEKYGYRVEDTFLLSSREAEEIKKSKWYLEVRHTANIPSYDIDINSHVILTGRLLKSILRMNTANVWIVGISGHADFNDLVYYVDVSRPDILIVDGYRSEHAHIFASYVKEHLGVRSVVLPASIQ
jgi:putative mRNA 3-end processing factor